jgi:serine/threonine protein kinase
MENCGQCTLDKIVAAADRRKLSHTEAFFIYSQILDGLEVLHEYGGCHRGIKPQNLIIQNDLKVKIIGFHKAVHWCEIINSQNEQSGPTIIGESSTTKFSLLNEKVGDYRFVPPEVMNNIPYDGRSVDLWGATVTLFYMLTGIYPFNRKQDD